MSMIMTPTKSRVTHSRGYRLTPEDGVAPSHDERRAIKRTCANDSAYAENPSVNDFPADEGGYPFANNESLHTELCKRDSAHISAILRSWGYEGDAADITRYRSMVAEFLINAKHSRTPKSGWVITATGEGYGHLTHPTHKAKSRAKSGRKSQASKATKPRSPDSAVDAMIRATGYTGVIDKRMRSAAREVLSHRESLARYTNG